MTAIVPLERPLVRRDDIVHGEAVKSSTWFEAARAANYVAGAGNTLVPMTRVPDVITSGVEYTYAFVAYPSPTSVLRMWTLVFDVATVTTADQWTVSAGSGPTSDVLVTWQALDKPLQTITYYEPLSASPAINVAQTLSLRVQRRAGSAALVAVSCVEVPRADLALVAPDLGVDLALVAPGEPIRAGAGWPAVSASLSLQRLDALFRRHLLAAAWPRSTPTAAEGLAVVATPVSIYPVGIPVLCRPRYSGEATRPCTAFVIARAASGETLRLTVTNAKSSASVTGDIALTATHTAYVLVPTLDIDTEDDAFDDGLRGGTLCTVTATVQRVAGVGTIHVSGFGLIETVA